MLVALGLAVLTRGSRLLRAGLIFAMVAALPYATMLALNGSVTDPDLALTLCKFGIGSVSLIGVALMMAILVVAGRFEQHRRLFAVALALATTTAIITWTTDIIIVGAWRTPWGMWFNTTGTFTDAQVLQFALWTSVGIVLARRRRSRLLNERQRGQLQLIVAGVALALLCMTDALLARRIGVYPFSFIPACMAIWMTIYAVVKQDMLQSKGFDWAAFYELIIVFVLAVAVVVAMTAINRAGGRWTAPHIVALVIAPAVLLAHSVAYFVRRRIRRRWRAEAASHVNAVDRFVEGAGKLTDAAHMRDELSALLQQELGLREVELLLPDGVQWAAPGTDEPVPLALDARVRTWLTVYDAPLITAEMLTERLGGLRKVIEAFMADLGADIVVPMVDRNEIVGLILAHNRGDMRALRDREKLQLMQATRAGARALTYLQLVRDAAEKIVVVKEVEVANAVQQARTTGSSVQRYGHHQLCSYYEPAEQFGGHWWASYRLSGGRILMVIGDVAGHGVSAALVSFTVEGACETTLRMMGETFDLLQLMQLLNQSVLDVGNGDYAMSCFAAVVDPAEPSIEFVGAGHPFPYVCRRAEPGPRGNATLRALVSRGTPLGAAEPHLTVSSRRLADDDVLVLYSDSIVNSRNPEDESYGERRLQRVLRTRVRDAAGQACQVIIDDARAFYCDLPIDEDLNLVVLRLNAV